MFRSCLLGLIVSGGLLVGINSPLRGQESDQARLTPAEIQSAIDFGKTDMPRPYLLLRAGSDGNPVVVALIYTPFVRVALLSYVATQRGSSVTPDDVSPDIVEPTVSIAFRWYYCCAPYDPPDPAAFDPLAPPDPEVLALSAGSSTFPLAAKGQSPVRLQKGATALARYGGPGSFNDIALVAAFPMTTLKAGQAFLIFKRYPNGSLQHRIGVIRASDIARWR